VRYRTPLLPPSPPPPSAPDRGLRCAEVPVRCPGDLDVRAIGDRSVECSRLRALVMSLVASSRLGRGGSRGLAILDEALRAASRRAPLAYGAAYRSSECRRALMCSTLAVGNRTAIARVHVWDALGPPAGAWWGARGETSLPAPQGAPSFQARRFAGDDRGRDVSISKPSGPPEGLHPTVREALLLPNLVSAVRTRGTRAPAVTAAGLPPLRAHSPGLQGVIVRCERRHAW